MTPLTRKGNPAVDVEFTQELDSLIDLLCDYHTASLQSPSYREIGWARSTEAHNAPAAPGNALRLILPSTQKADF